MKTDSPRWVYLDSSSYVALLLKEPRYERVAKAIVNRHLCSSVLLVVETKRTLLQLVRLKAINEEIFSFGMAKIEEDLADFFLREVTLDLCLSQVFPLASVPRSLDMLHLRTALWFHAQQPLERFLSLDEKQNRAAKELRLPIHEVMR